jgi:hypothetical protein
MARPRGSKDEQPWTAALRRALAKRETKTGRQYLDRVADACVKAAMGGDVIAMREIGDRLDGKAVQRAELSGKDGAPLAPVINLTVGGVAAGS